MPDPTTAGTENSGLELDGNTSSQAPSGIAPPVPQSSTPAATTSSEGENATLTSMIRTLSPAPSFLWNPTALAFAETTPWLARLLLPTLCLGTHCLFYYAQTAPMWRLHVFSDIDVWANATDFTTRRFYDTVGLKYDNEFSYMKDYDVQTFSYITSTNHLWDAKGMKGTFLPKLAAILLVVVSGLWPHIKLLCLHWIWFFGKQADRRTSSLQWLSTLGKWSLADVLVVCVMIGVLNLDWEVDPDNIKQGIITNLPSIIAIVQSQYDEEGLCDHFLKVSCANAQKVTTKTKCKACIKAVTEAYTRPEWAQSTGASILKGVETSGGGLATLRVIGMRGIYAFCSAVIASILLSLIVDIFDHRAKCQALRQQALTADQEQLERIQYDLEQRESQADDDNNYLGNGSLSEPLLSTTSPLEVDIGDDNSFLSLGQPHRRRAGRQGSRCRRPLFSCSFLSASIICAALVFAAVDWYTMERKLYGAGPELAQNILGVDWNRDYSLRTLMWTTGSHGGFDNLLMATFCLFLVLGPVIRAVLVVISGLLDGCNLPVATVGHSINFIGAFCAWEVFATSIAMVQLLMPTLTNTIYNSDTCAKLSDDGACFKVEFNLLLHTFWTVVAGGALLIGTSLFAVKQGTDIHASLHENETNQHPAEHPYSPINEDLGPSDGINDLAFETNQL